MNLIQMYLTLLQFSFNIRIQFFFIYNTPESFLNSLASFLNLSFKHSILNPTTLLELLKNSIFFVNSMQFSIFDVHKSSFPCIIRVLWLFYLFLFHIHYLPDMKNVFNSSHHISYYFLWALNLLINCVSIIDTTVNIWRRTKIVWWPLSIEIGLIVVACRRLMLSDRRDLNLNSVI